MVSWNMVKFARKSGSAASTSMTTRPAHRCAPKRNRARSGFAAITEVCLPASMSNPLHGPAPPDAGGAHHQDGDDDEERDRKLQFGPDLGDVGAGEIFDDADRKAADHGAG